MPNKKELRIGETRTMNNGLKATIVTYRHNGDIDIMFEDGAKREHVQYGKFFRGEIKHPEHKSATTMGRIGETKTMKNGLNATIIAYRSWHDIDLRFEDGFVKEHVSYDNFSLGSIGHPSHSVYKKDIIGETRTMNNGLKATVIDYKNKGNIDVQFEDGLIRKNVYYRSFVNGAIKHTPNKSNSLNMKEQRIGETRTMNNGLKATIVAYRNSNDMDIQFENGVIKENINYYNFSNGYISCNKHEELTCTHHIEETKTMNNGLKATVIAYRNYHDIDVQFEDGTIREKVHYRNFSKGEVRHPVLRSPNYTPKYEHIGEEKIMNNGLKATIVAYRGVNDMDIQFEDGAVREHVFYSSFTTGKIKHPTLETKYKPSKNGAAKHLGETRIMKSGLEATIIEWRSSADIDLRFEDGAVKKGVKSSDFYKGCIGHPERKRKENLCDTPLSERFAAAKKEAESLKQNGKNTSLEKEDKLKNTEAEMEN